ncbi:MAG: McrC family protein [Lachnospiraceae bacterium]|nr:McrC family protein [Lachnospiraceae bacterium]
MKQLKIKDNQYRKKEDYSEIRSVVNQVVDKTLEQLEREGVFVFPEGIKEAEDISNEQMVLQSYNDMYCSGNIMGFLGSGDERLIIESRFSLGETDYFFQYLLEKVLDFPNFINLETSANQDDKMFNLLLFLFPHYLKNAARKGAFKMYIRKDYNDGNVKGTIDVNKHIQKNIPFVGNIAYSQREYSYENYLMELIRHTIEFIKGKSYGYKLLNLAKDEVKLVIDATPKYHAADRRNIVEKNKKNIIRHAYYHEYRDLQKLCILILQNQRHQFGYSNRKVYGILFDGAWLWEEYINTLISNDFYHPMNKQGSGAQRLFSGNVGLIYPDFLGKRVENRVVADAKYKPIDNIGNKDYLQVLAYMFRFDAKRGYYLYPEATQGSSLYLKLNKGSTYEKNVSAREDISVIKHGLKIPRDCDSYSEFVNKIGENEEHFVTELLKSELELSL